MATVAALGAPRLLGQGNPGRRVLVGIQLMGGNDSNNLVVPLDPQAYNAYARARGELALPASSLLPIQSNRLRTTFGMPAQVQELAALYRQQALAVVANVGDLSRSITRGNASAAVAPDASSHTAASKMQFLQGGWVTPSWWSSLLKETPEEFAARAFKFSDGLTTASSDGSWINGAREDNPDLISAINSVAVQTPFPQTGIGDELLRAVKLAQAGANIGLGNQLITCVMSGWDTHRNELPQNAKLYADLSQALFAFYTATQELRISQNVTAFTWSEFNRAIAANSKHGTEHGWGGHQLVLGGAVAGGEIYGSFPSFELGGPDDFSGNGSWIPTTSTTQFAATLAHWFGGSPSLQRSEFPGVANFATSNLGFFKE